MGFNRSNWYWVVENRSAPANVFALSRAAYIANNDPTYVSWLATKNPTEHHGNYRPTMIVSDGELAQVLFVAGCPNVTITAAAGSTPNWGSLTSALIAPVLLTLGLNVTSTGSPTLNGVYSCSSEVTQAITSIATYIQGNGKFPGGQSTFSWPDAAGNPHVFSSTVEFLDFSTAVGNYAIEVTVAATQPSPTWPANTVTIP